MALLTREQILAADDRGKTEIVPVPEWGGDVSVGVISGDERDRFDLFREKQGKKSDVGVRALLVAMSCVDGDGKPLFKPADVMELGKKSSRALDRVFEAALRVNGLGQDAIEERVGNCSSGQSDDSGTSSPEPSLDAQ